MRRAAVLVGLFGSVWSGCNLIAGIEDGTLAPADAGSVYDGSHGGGGGGGAGGGGGGGVAGGGGGGVTAGGGGGGGQGLDGGNDASSGCDAGQALCGGNCIDVTGDNANCGGCGLTCSANDCDAGRCLVTLATLPAGAGFQFAFNGIAVDPTNVYWPYSAAGDGGVQSVPVGGGTVTTIASGENQPCGVASNGSIVYWTVNNGGGQNAVMASTVPPLAPNVGTIASGFTTQSDICPIALSGSYIYFTDINGGGNDFVMGVFNSNGSTPFTLANVGTEMFGVAADSNWVYWPELGNGNISRVGLDGGTVEHLATGQNLPDGIVVDPNNVYWITESGTVAMVALVDGGSPTVLATGQTPSALAVDSAYVYWDNYKCTVDGGPCPSILKVPIGGGPATPLLYDQPNPYALAVDGTSVYWTDATSGKVMKLTPK
jgi:uncharacterized protein DUF5050